MPPADGPKPLVVVGSANADLVVRINRLPLAGETLAAEDFSTFPGGKGANQAAAAGRLEYPTFFIGQFGGDGFADLIRDSLRNCGVDCSLCRQVDAPTGNAVILLQPNGENSIIIVGGANQNGWDITEGTEELIRGAGMVLLQREIPEEVNAEVAEVAAAAGVPVVLDAGGREGALDPGLLRRLAVLSPNETELARMTGMPTGSAEQVEAAAAALLGEGVGAVLVKLGSKGSLLLRPGETPFQQDAVPVEKIVDTTGAGDCYTAAWAVGRLRGLSPERAMAFASAAAAICVQGMGAASSLPRRADVEELFGRA